MSSTPNPLFQYFPSTPDGRICSTCQAPFGPKTGNSTMRRHLQRTHPQQMQQYINQGGSVPGSTPAKVKLPGGGKQSRKSAPPLLQQQQDEVGFNGIANATAQPSTSSSSPLAPTLPPLPTLPLLITPTFGLPTTSAVSSLPTSLSTATLPTSSSSTSSSSSPPSAFCPPGTSIGVPFSDCSLEQLRLSQQHFSNERQWLRFHTPRNLLLALVGEVGELAECFQWREDSEPGLPTWTAPDREALGEELSDVLLYLVRLSDRCGIDLSAAATRKLAVNAGKYPAKRVRGSSAKYNKYVKEDEEGKEDEAASGGSGSAVNGEVVVEGKKPRKKRKARSTDTATTDTAAAAAAAGEQESQQRDGSQSAVDDRKEPEANSTSMKAE